MKFLIFNVIGFLILALVFSVASTEVYSTSDPQFPVPPAPGVSNDTSTTPSPSTTSTTSPTTTNATTTTKPSSTSTTTSMPPTTPSSSGTTSTSTTSQPPTTTSLPTSTTNSTTTTTSKPSPTPTPDAGRKFDLPSFIGGFVLAAGLMAIAVISWKFYLSRQENYYHTL